MDIITGNTLYCKFFSSSALRMQTTHDLSSAYSCELTTDFMTISCTDYFDKLTGSSEHTYDYKTTTVSHIRQWTHLRK